MDDSNTRRSALPSVWPYPRSNGSITTFAWKGDVLWTSMMRGFKKALLCMLIPQGKTRDGYRPGSWQSVLRLLRIKLDDQALVDILAELGTIGRSLERTCHLFHVDFNPRRKANLLGELKRVDDAQLGLGAFLDRDDVPGPNQRRCDVDHLAVDRHRAMRHELPCFCARGAEAHAVHDVVEARLQQAQQVFTRRALAVRRHRKIPAELPLENAVGAAKLLLFAQ